MYSLIISLAPLLDNYIGHVVSHSLIKGHLGVENSHFGDIITKREIYSFIISLAPLLDTYLGYVVSHSLI